jgi:hypothetical protein
MTVMNNYYFCCIMRRRKRQVVEGITLDLTDPLMIELDIVALLTKIGPGNGQQPPKAEKTITLINDEEIVNKILPKKHCDTCRKPIFTSVKIWRGAKLCMNCHAIAAKDISPELSDYIKGVYSSGCVFCDVKHGRFHLDHINMFTKVDSVCHMLDRGETVENIISEVAKCQLLCINCHTLVTSFEAKRGFLKKKRGLNRKIAAGVDVTELRQQLYDEYEAVMVKVYPLLREKVTRIHDEDTIQHEIGESDESGDDG